MKSDVDSRGGIQVYQKYESLKSLLKAGEYSHLLEQ